MFKKTLITAFLIICMSAPGVINTVSAGFAQCQTYDCQLAQQEIQYLYDAIYYEKQKPYPNWNAIRQAEQRIRWLMTIR